MFPSKKYNRIETVNNQKVVVFEENGKEMGITNLSSGEKQIVFRGSFLLKDKKSSKGALILIDEPEISLHPTWQLKILTFFKKLFSNEGMLTSQLIVATHSPFIIHNANRNDDKVIVLKKDNNSKISIADDPQFFSWSQERKVIEAFKVAQILKQNLITVFVEGETDEKYFKKAIEIYEADANIIDFKWIGRINESGNAENTGDSALNQVRKFFRANMDMVVGKVVLLYDNDTNKQEETFDNLEVRKMATNNLNTIYEIGIENLLIIPDSFDKEQYYKEREKKDKYGAESIIRELDKTKLCNYVCENLNLEKQKDILINLKTEIDKLKE
jgi:predicted ATP-dependent endonuclease of OLD family